MIIDDASRRKAAGLHKRTRPAKLLTMSPEAWERLDLIASRAGLSRSAMVETLVRGAEVPRAKTATRRENGAA